MNFVLRLVFLLGFAFLSNSYYAFTEPKITCLSVKTNGNVLISFIEPIDKTQGLVGYKIYYSNSAPIPTSGTFLAQVNAIPNTPPANLTFTDPTNLGNLDPIYYRIDAVNASGTVVKSSQSIGTINLRQQSSGTQILLTWTAPAANIFDVTATGFKYEILRFVNNILDTIYQSKPTSFQDFAPGNCAVPVRYMIRLKTIYGCAFESNKILAAIPNGIELEPVKWDSASFDENNNLIITWPQIKTNDTIVSTSLYMFKDPSPTEPSALSTFLINKNKQYNNNRFVISTNLLILKNKNPAKTKITFALTDSNACGYSSNPIPSVRFSPIFIDSSNGKCEYPNSYIMNFTGGSEIERGVVYYKTFLKIAGEDYRVLDSIPALIGRNNSYPYILDSLEEGKTYTFFIRAYNEFGNATASSMRYTFTPKFENSVEPNSFMLKSISTNTLNEQNIAKVIYSGQRNIIKFELMRKEVDAGVNGDFQVVGSTNYVIGQKDYLVKDLSPKIFTKSYFYYVRAINSCNLVAGNSDTHRNVLLDIKTGKDVYHQKLTWNNYEGYTKGVKSYNIYRVVDFKTTFEPIISLAPAPIGELNVFEDDVRKFSKNDVRIVYYITSVEAPGNIYGSDSAVSNIDTANAEPDFFIPSAFSPNGNSENQVFKPARFYIASTDYLFEIYNKWGQVVWSTNNPNLGWDGKDAQSDVYVYKILYLDSEGRKRSRYGDFILIK
jgi:hypothetical protein